MTLEPKTYMGALIPCFINVLSIHYRIWWKLAKMAIARL
jgi:hypothetical protein